VDCPEGCPVACATKIIDDKRLSIERYVLMTKIEILGTGCAKCKRLYANAEQAVKDLKITAEVVKVDDIVEIVSRGVMVPPALFINGEMRAEGRIPDVNEIKKILTE
jgi:small redox-active disulfide protein 2